MTTGTKKNLSTSDLAVDPMLDNLSHERSGSGRFGSGPYRDGRAALIARRKSLAEQLGRLQKSEDRASDIKDYLRFVDAELQVTVQPRLAHIRPARPCKQAWESMPTNGNRRRCQRCEHVVVDVSAMSEDEVQSFLDASDQNPLIRLRRRKDGRLVTGECPMSRRRSVLKAAARAAVTAAIGATAGAMVLTTHSNAPTERLLDTVATKQIQLSRQVHVLAESARRPGADAFTPPAAPITISQLLADGIRQTGRRTWEISAPVLGLLSEPNLLTNQIVVIPHETEGSTALALYGIHPDSAASRLGLRNGDRILSVNGRQLEDPNEALAAYDEIRETGVVRVVLERRGAILSHWYTVASPRES